MAFGFPIEPPTHPHSFYKGVIERIRQAVDAEFGVEVRAVILHVGQSVVVEMRKVTPLNPSFWGENTHTTSTPPQVFFTSPTFITRIIGSPSWRPQSVHDEYW